MKAFQLKVAIKNSHPPIWRRVIVPAGITFSQLGMILNKAMGWCGYHMFEVEFYHLQQRIIEGADEFAGHDWTFDFVEASETYIREYLEKNEWFTYTYDMGDNWQHRVTVEKVLTDYELNYPQVVKYKGECPVEDCGGLGGYYRLQEILKDKTHPEYEEMYEWAGAQGGFSLYDIDAVNRELEQEFFYRWGTGETRCQGEIYEEHFSGKYGLNATKRDKNKELPKEQLSAHHQLQEMMRKFEENFAFLRDGRQESKRVSLAEIFDDFEKKDILDIAKEKGVKGVTKCNKEELINRLIEHMMRPEVIKPFFLCMDNEEMNAFEQAAETVDFYEPENAGNFLHMYDAAYIGMLEDGSIMIPKEVEEAYNALKGAEFERERKKFSYIRACLETMSVLHGISPMEIFMKLVKQNKQLDITEKDVEDAIKEIPYVYGEYVLAGDTVYAKTLYLNDGGLLSAQRGKEFYIPTYREILEFGKKGYVSEHKEAGNFKLFLRERMNCSFDEAECLVSFLQLNITGGCDIRDLFEILEDAGIEPKNEKMLNKLSKHVFELWNSTRMILNRGFTPAELDGGRELEPVKKNSSNDLIEFPAERIKKVYPNDPCPCGSGKKYKNCCKNK